MDAPKIAELKLFIDRCKSEPSILHDPSLSFFKSYLQSLGARIPLDKGTDKSCDNMAEPAKCSFYEEDEEDIVESDIEFDTTDVVQPDNDPPQKMGDPSVEVTEEKEYAAQAAKLRATDAISEGKLEEAVSHLTEAIMLNPSSAILYASRASAFIKLNKPNAAIRDADVALEINPDSAKGYKTRGMAKAMLGQWLEAASDLHIASKLDFDEEIALVLKKVEPNLQKIDEHRRKYKQLWKERDLKKAELVRKQEKDALDQETLSALRDGQVLGIHSASELETKLNAATRTSRLAILYFTATWCGPCRFMSPIYASLADKYQKVVFLKIDIDEVRDVAARWNISSVPSFFFMRDGKEVDKVIGADKSALERKIARYA